MQKSNRVYARVHLVEMMKEGFTIKEEDLNFPKMWQLTLSSESI